MVLDMTTGSPIRRIVRFFIPVLLGNLLQQLYSLADSVIVSRFIGVKAFAGVSATGSVNFLILGFTMGICAGFAIPVSQEFGAGNPSEMRRCFGNGLLLSLAIAAVMAVVTGILTPQILRLLRTPEDIFDYSVSYIRVIFIGIPATVLYNLLSGVMRAVGDGRTPLIMLLISSVLNVVLDLACILVLRMGITGAAVATVFSQLVSGFLCLWVIFRKTDVLRVRGDEWKFSRAISSRLLGYGLPMGLQFSITAIGSTMLQSAVNTLGSGAVTAIGAGAKVQFFFTTPLEAVGVTMATYCGQNLGARKIDRVRKGVRQTTIFMAVYCALAFGLQMAFGRTMSLLFLDASEAEILDNAMIYLNTVLAFSFLLALVLIYRNAIQGLGYSRVAMLAGLLELVGRAFVAFVLVRAMGYQGACFAHPMAWLCADALLVPLYIHIVHTYEKRFA